LVCSPHFDSHLNATFGRPGPGVPVMSRGCREVQCVLAARIRGLGDWVQGVCVRALQVILVVGVLVGRALRVIVGRVGGAWRDGSVETRCDVLSQWLGALRIAVAN
jgi:hypothetical protein